MEHIHSVLRRRAIKRDKGKIEWLAFSQQKNQPGAQEMKPNNSHQYFIFYHCNIFMKRKNVYNRIKIPDTQKKLINNTATQNWHAEEQ